MEYASKRGCVVWIIWDMIFINRRCGIGHTFCVMLPLRKRFSPQNGVLSWKKIRGVIFVMLLCRRMKQYGTLGMALNVQNRHVINSVCQL